jgi:hypothetical protein
VSLPAMTWVLYDVDPTEVDAYGRLVLLYIADQATHTGHGAVISRRALADATGLSETTVGKYTRQLRRAGLISPGDPQVVAHLPANRRPAVWDLPLPKAGRHRRQPARRETKDRDHQQKRRRGSHTDPQNDHRGSADDPQTGGRQGVARGSFGGRRCDDTPNTPTAPHTPGVAAGGSRPPAGGDTDRDPCGTEPLLAADGMLPATYGAPLLRAALAPPGG